LLNTLETHMENTQTGTTAFAPGFAGNGDGALHSAASAAHDAVNAATGFAEGAARKAQPAIDRMAAKAHQAVDTAADAAAPTADFLAAQGESLKAAQKKLMDETCTYVAANPLKSVGIALVAGFFLSRIVLR
jgi:ElaB/YqjD/DUF883 family membrane-anchored ribosome-binding protein